jgi:catechol 1,2-dioxygenase
VNYLHELGGRQEAALLAAGLGLEHFLDLRQDAIDAAAHRETGTPRTIEGPLYVANAPLVEGHARMDDGLDAGEVMWLHGQVCDTQGRPVANAIVDIWHANTLGNYSFFDQSQSEYNLRRRIRTGADGRYSVRSIMPSGYGCPPDGPTQKLLNQLGRHGNRPAHIHFFVSAPGHKHLTSQINLNGDKYLWDDFAFATRDGLIADPVKITDRELIAQRKLDGEHTEVRFDFTLCPPSTPKKSSVFPACAHKSHDRYTSVPVRPGR